MKKEDIWLVVPIYNEGKYLNRVFSKLKKYTPNIIAVDDGSSDDSVQIASKYTPHLLTHDLNLGKGAALKTGCEYAFRFLGAQGVIFFDSDDQHNPAELNLFFEKLEAGDEAVFGERAMNTTMPLTRIIGNRLASVAILFLFGSYVPDIPSGFKAISKKTYNKIKWKASGYGVELEIAAKIAQQKIPFSVIPISTIYHDFDRGMNILDVIKIVFKLINLKLTI